MLYDCGVPPDDRDCGPNASPTDETPETPEEGHHSAEDYEAFLRPFTKDLP